MTDEEIREILLRTRTIASVGLSADPAKVSHSVAAYLLSQGYRVIPVNPTAETILGQTVFADLDSVPGPIDVVQVFRPSEDVPPIVEAAIRKGASVVWMQVGISNREAAQKGAAAGLTVLMDRCMRSEHQRLMARRASS